jgi:hypothetical protein
MNQNTIYSRSVKFANVRFIDIGTEKKSAGNRLSIVPLVCGLIGIIFLIGLFLNTDLLRQEEWLSSSHEEYTVVTLPPRDIEAETITNTTFEQIYRQEVWTRDVKI